MEERGYIDLLTLQEYTAAAVSEAFPDVLWVKAEISSVSVKSNGHCYLELSQSDEGGTLVAKARAVIWRSRYSTLLKSFIEQTGQAPEAGMEVMLQVQVSFSPLWGLTLTVEDIDGAYVLGQRELQKRQTLERLASEGLLDMQKELCLPVLPYRLAVISAEGAAGWGDFRKHLLENEYGFVLRAELFEATMQGASAPASIISALETICETGCGHKASVAFRFAPSLPTDGWAPPVHVATGGHRPVSQEQSPGNDIAVLIGPEGDFSPEEARMAIAAGFVPIHLGESRLRTETAAIAAVAAVYFHHI